MATPETWTEASADIMLFSDDIGPAIDAAEAAGYGVADLGGLYRQHRDRIHVALIMKDGAKFAVPASFSRPA